MDTGTEAAAMAATWAAAAALADAYDDAPESLG